MEVYTLNTEVNTEVDTSSNDVEKKSNLQIGTKVLVTQNIYGNECECFVGLTGTILSFKKNNWYRVSLDTKTIYGTNFNFHFEEIEIYDRTKNY